MSANDSQQRDELPRTRLDYYFDDETNPENATEVTLYDAEADEADLVCRWITIDREHAVHPEDWR